MLNLPEGKYEHVSPIFKDVIGYSQEELLKNPLFIKKIIHPDFAYYFEKEWNELINGKIPPSY